MTHICIVGGGSALSQHVIQHYLDKGAWVSALCRHSGPSMTHERLKPYYKGDGVPKSLDIVITMCGKVRNATIKNMEYSEWEESISDNLSSVFYHLKNLLPEMHTEGNVVVVGSIVGSMGGYGCANYAAAKAGLVGLVNSVAVEYVDQGIVCNLLKLGYVNCGMGANLPEMVRQKITTKIPLRRFAKPSEVVQAIDFLGSTRYMTGEILTLSGGLR